MLAARRRDLITDALRADSVVTSEGLARTLGVSVETVRRDLIALERGGSLRRVHGGAMLTDTFTGQEPPFDDRQSLSGEEKQAIGRRAAALVTNGTTLVLDVGTTALEVARALPADFHGTVATCSLLVATELAGRRDVEVLVSGGRLRGGDLALSNATTIAFFADMRADLAFLGSGGLDATAGLTDFHLDEIATRRTIIANSVASYVLADGTKLGRVAPHRVCDLAEVTGLITGGTVPASLRIAFEGGGAEVLAATG